MDTLTPPSQKKGLSPLAWVGIGCGSLTVIGVIAVMVIAAYLGPKAKKFADEMQKNPARATASMMVSASMGTMEMIAEDDAAKRYTIREKQSRKLTTVYWDAKTNAPAVIEGDFSAIPADAGAPPQPVVVPEQQ